MTPQENIILTKNQVSLLRTLVDDLAEDVTRRSNDPSYTAECLQKLIICYTSLLKINDLLVK